MQEDAARWQAQLEFALEIDKLKQIFRQNSLVDGTRRENDAEHSWHLAVLAILLAEYSRQPLDLKKVMQMVVLHDIVEIDAGDTFCYDPQAGLDQEEREKKAAKRLFGLLPPDQKEQFQSLWREFEAGQSAEAKFAVCLDRLQPFLINYHTGGGTWRQHKVTSAQVRERMAPVGEASPILGQYVDHLIDEAIAKGYLKREG